MYIYIYIRINSLTEHTNKERDTPAIPSYMLNIRSAETNTVFYSYVACFVNTAILNMEMSMSYTGVNQAEYGIRILVAASQEYVYTYSTRRPLTPAVPSELSRRVTGIIH